MTRPLQVATVFRWTCWYGKVTRLSRLLKHMVSPTLFRFILGPWSPCSATCGPGRQTREVKCQVLLSFTKAEVDLPEEECGKDRPQLERPCNQRTCNKDYGLSYLHTTEQQYSWDYRDFTACSATCAAGELWDMVLAVQML